MDVVAHPEKAEMMYEIAEPRDGPMSGGFVAWRASCA